MKKIIWILITLIAAAPNSVFSQSESGGMGGEDDCSYQDEISTYQYTDWEIDPRNGQLCERAYSTTTYEGFSGPCSDPANTWESSGLYDVTAIGEFTGNCTDVNCDPSDPSSNCYNPPCDPYDPNDNCYVGGGGGTGGGGPTGGGGGGGNTDPNHAQRVADVIGKVGIVQGAMGAGFTFTTDLTKLTGFSNEVLENSGAMGISRTVQIAGRAIGVLSLAADVYAANGNAERIGAAVADVLGIGMAEIPVVGTIASIIYFSAGGNTAVKGLISRWLQ